MQGVVCVHEIVPVATAIARAARGIFWSTIFTNQHNKGPPMFKNRTGSVPRTHLMPCMHGFAWKTSRADVGPSVG